MSDELPPPPPPPPPPPAMPPPADGQGQPLPGPQPFDATQAFDWGFKRFRDNLGTILLAVLIYVGITVAVLVVGYLLIAGAFLSTAELTIDPETGAITSTGGSGLFATFMVSLLMVVLFWVVLAFLQAALVRGGLMIADGHDLEIGAMFKFERIGTVILASLIVGIISGIASFIPVAGPLLVAFFTPFYVFFIIDKGAGAWESIVASFTLVKDNLGSVLVLLLLAWVLYIVGLVACLIGLLVTAPVAFLGITYGYRKLQGDPVAE